MNHVTIIPNIQTQLLKDERTSFFSFIPPNTTVWAKDLKFVATFIDENFKKAKTGRAGVKYRYRKPGRSF